MEFNGISQWMTENLSDSQPEDSCPDSEFGSEYGSCEYIIEDIDPSDDLYSAFKLLICESENQFKTGRAEEIKIERSEGQRNRRNFKKDRQAERQGVLEIYKGIKCLNSTDENVFAWGSPPKPSSRPTPGPSPPNISKKGKFSSQCEVHTTDQIIHKRYIMHCIRYIIL